MVEFDPGPPQAIAQRFAECPDYGDLKKHFWYDWEPIFYRGRLDGTAKVMCVASDPGATERIAARTLVGDAGQRVQGFLAKLGLTRSYVCLNAFSYALIPGQASAGDNVLTQPQQTAWRNGVFDAIRTPALKVVIAFGAQAQRAVRLWPGRTTLTVVEIPHPSSHDEAILLKGWRKAVDDLRLVIASDPDGDTTLPNYGTKFMESDYAAIPRRDLPYGVPSFLGDDRKGRAATPSVRTSVSRPVPDDRHTLKWIAPRSA